MHIPPWDNISENEKFEYVVLIVDKYWKWCNRTLARTLSLIKKKYINNINRKIKENLNKVLLCNIYIENM